MFNYFMDEKCLELSQQNIFFRKSGHNCYFHLFILAFSLRNMSNITTVTSTNNNSWVILFYLNLSLSFSTLHIILKQNLDI